VQKLLEVAPDYEPDQDQDLQTWIELVEATKQRGRQNSAATIAHASKGATRCSCGTAKKGSDKNGYGSEAEV
jgi:hypothetical protein